MKKECHFAIFKKKITNIIKLSVSFPFQTNLSETQSAAAAAGSTATRTHCDPSESSCQSQCGSLSNQQDGRPGSSQTQFSTGATSCTLDDIDTDSSIPSVSEQNYSHVKPAAASAGEDTYSIVGSLNGGAGTFMNGVNGTPSYPAGLPLLSMCRLQREDPNLPSLRLPGGMFASGRGGRWPGGAEPVRTDGRANPQPLRMEDLLSIRLDQVTFDLSQPPYDSLQTYEFEGRDSRAESLSSLESDGEKEGGSAGSTGGMDELNQKFRRLVEIIREREKEKKEGGGEGGGASVAAAAEETTATVTAATHEQNEVTEKKERQKWDF